MKNIHQSLKGSMFLGTIILSSLSGCQKEELIQANLAMDEIEMCAPIKKDKFYIGQEYGGGIIYYIDATGKHGLIVAKEDLGPAPWGCEGTLVPYTLDDEQMTKNILAACNEPGIAARLCDEYVVYVKRSWKDKDFDEEKDNYERKESYNHNDYNKGHNKNKWRKYDDWFMPRDIGPFFDSRISANLVCTTYYWTTIQATSYIGGAANPAYRCLITGTACVNNLPYRVYVTAGNKSDMHYVRPVRKF
jgi:hypothetical protein